MRALLLALQAGLLLLIVAASGCGESEVGRPDSGAPADGVPDGRTDRTRPDGAACSLMLSSGAFAEGETIPPEHGCQGADRSPPLDFGGVPDGTAAFVLIVEDVDAFDFLHWLVHDIPPEATGLAAGVPTIATLADGSRQGTNDFGQVGWGGPCPPPGDGPHAYVFTLFALDSPLGLPEDAGVDEVRRAMEGRILGTAELRGRFEL